MSISVDFDPFLLQRASALLGAPRLEPGRPHYSLKQQAGRPVHGGPYAILVRGMAKRARDLVQLDYLGMPEIIKNLSSNVQAQRGLDLLPTFEQRWRRAVVKFTVPAGTPSEFALAVALRYLRAVELKGKPDQGAVWCFDCENQAVPSERILRVDFV